MPGTLFVVATPIGNLEDLTFRALRTLKEVDVIAAEDTRRTSKLLSHYAISKPLLSLREHNEAREAAKLIVRLKAGQNVALVSDAGTPAIADPGARLVRAARSAGIQVLPIPGPSAITAAISVSGLDTTEFMFMGFPPPARLARRSWLEGLRNITGPIVIFEAPHRIVETINDMEEILVNRQIQIFREITKINEEYVKRPTKLDESWQPQVVRGEYTVVIGQSQTVEQLVKIDQPEVYGLFNLISGSGIISDAAARRSVAAGFDLEIDEVTKAIKKGRILAKRQIESAP